MIKLSIKSVNYNFINYYNKLVLNKNLQFLFYKDKKKRNVLHKIKKKKNYNVVTLRAPKHFKVGRHHYHVIKKLYYLKYINFKINILLPKQLLYKFLNIYKNIMEKKKITQILSELTMIKMTVKLESSFFLL